MKTPSSKRDAGWYGVAALVSGVCVFGLLGLSRIVGTLEIVPLLSQRSLHNWNFTFLNVTRFVLSCMALVAVVPTIVFAIIGKKRLSPLSKPHDRINLNVGLILGILYCSIVVVMLILLERCCNTRTTIGER